MAKPNFITGSLGGRLLCQESIESFLKRDLSIHHQKEDPMNAVYLKLTGLPINITPKESIMRYQPKRIPDWNENIQADYTRDQERIIIEEGKKLLAGLKSGAEGNMDIFKSTVKNPF